MPINLNLLQAIQAPQVVGQITPTDSTDGGIKELMSGIGSLAGALTGKTQPQTQTPYSNTTGTYGSNYQAPNKLETTIKAAIPGLTSQKGVNLTLAPDFESKLPMFMEDLRQQGFQPIIASGNRTVEEQQEKVRQGFSKTINSRHIGGNAVDIIDSRYGWNIKKYDNEIKAFATAMNNTAQKYGLISGTQWKSFGPYGDFAHIEYRNKPQSIGGYNKLQAQSPTPLGTVDPTKSKKYTNLQNQFSIPTVVSSASRVYQDNPIMAQVAATQAILESGLNSKPSSLAAQHNNLFGIKGSGTAGTTIMNTKEQGKAGLYSTRAGFAKNATIEDSYLQHQKLMSNPRYQKVINARTPEEAFIELQNSGYATDKNYAKKLMNIYQTYVAPMSSIGPTSLNDEPSQIPNPPPQAPHRGQPLPKPGQPIPQQWDMLVQNTLPQAAQSLTARLNDADGGINWGLLEQILQQKGLA